MVLLLILGLVVMLQNTFIWHYKSNKLTIFAKKCTHTTNNSASSFPTQLEIQCIPKKWQNFLFYLVSVGMTIFVPTVILSSSAVLYDFIGFILLLVTAATIIQYSKHRNEANLTRLPICVDINNPADMPNFVLIN